MDNTNSTFSIGIGKKQYMSNINSKRINVIKIISNKVANIKVNTLAKEYYIISSEYYQEKLSLHIGGDKVRGYIGGLE